MFHPWVFRNQFEKNDYLSVEKVVEDYENKLDILYLEHPFVSHFQVYKREFVTIYCKDGTKIGYKFKHNGHMASFIANICEPYHN